MIPLHICRTDPRYVEHERWLHEWLLARSGRPVIVVLADAPGVTSPPSVAVAIEHDTTFAGDLLYPRRWAVPVEEPAGWWLIDIFVDEPAGEFPLVWAPTAEFLALGQRL